MLLFLNILFSWIRSFEIYVFFFKFDWIQMFPRSSYINNRVIHKQLISNLRMALVISTKSHNLQIMRDGNSCNSLIC